jgi:hypothetical protein
MKYLIAAILLAIIGAIYTFMPPQTIVAWGIGFLRHNDRVLFGILCLEIAAIFVFKLLKK